MSTLEPNTGPMPQLTPDLRRLLGDLRRQIRGYVWRQGLAAVGATVVAAFWICLALDWYFEPSTEVRQAMLAVAGVAVAWVLFRQLISRLAVRLSDENMAVLLERRYPHLQDSLLTAVQLTGRPENLDPFAREMLDHACRQAHTRATAVELRGVFNFAPLRKWLIAASVLVLGTVVYGALNPSALAFGARRLALLTDAPWPRFSRLAIEGFPDGQAVIAKGSSLEVLVRADTSMVVPDTVEVRYRYDDGARGRDLMVREGAAVPGQDPYQLFKYVFQSVPSDVRFDVRGGDDRIRNLHIRVVDSPTMDITLECEYPDYMNRSPRELPVTGIMAIERGTKIRVIGRANKDLVEVRVDYPTGPDAFDTRVIAIPDQRGSDREFAYEIDWLDADMTLGFTLLDTDGIRNRETIRLVLVAVPDEAPQLAVNLRGIGRAVTPQARLPFVGEITDDHGIDQAWIEYLVDEGDEQTRPFEQAAGGRNRLAVDEAFEVRDLKLKPGQKLLIGAKARDQHRLPDDDLPRVGHGERFLLDVVSAEQLRAMLESQELNLRQRFETILGEVTEMRDSLTRLEGDSFAAWQPVAEEGAPSRTTAEPVVAEDDEAGGEGDTPARIAARNRLRIERAAQNSKKSAQETLGVATGFDGIREELINNRVDTEELRIRLKDYIADPLKQIGGPMFDELVARLDRLNKQLTTDNDAARQQAHRDVLDQADAVLVAMIQVRDKMLELETFNEALELLRSIIASQKDVNERTKQQRSEQLRRLLD